MDTGFKSPTATGGTYNDFTNPSNAYSSDGQYATAAATSTTVNQSYEDLNFGVPRSAIIEKVEIKVEHFEAGGSLDPKAVFVHAYGAASESETGQYVTWSTEETTQTIDVTNAGFIPADFTNANFYARIRLYNSGGTEATISLDHIQVKVTYTLAPKSGVINFQYPAIV